MQVQEALMLMHAICFLWPSVGHSKVMKIMYAAICCLARYIMYSWTNLVHASAYVNIQQHKYCFQQNYTKHMQCAGSSMTIDQGKTALETRYSMMQRYVREKIGGRNDNKQWIKYLRCTESSLSFSAIGRGCIVKKDRKEPTH